MKIYIELVTLIERRGVPDTLHARLLSVAFADLLPVAVEDDLWLVEGGTRLRYRVINIRMMIEEGVGVSAVINVVAPTDRSAIDGDRLRKHLGNGEKIPGVVTPTVYKES